MQKLKRNLGRLPYLIKDKWTDLIHVYPANIKRIIQFIPVLWKDWNFSSDPGIYLLLRKKLELLEPCLKDGHCEGGEKRAKEIRIALFLLNRLIKDDYDKEALQAVRKNPAFGFVPGETEYEGWIRIDGDKGKREQRRKIAMKEFEKARRKRERDNEFVFNLIRDKHLGWWD